uniref:Uncharacterized protein n=1 Tax=Octactis speculum TaxID=3111310 RepID=A0A7S2CZU6_9STRA
MNSFTDRMPAEPTVFDLTPPTTSINRDISDSNSKKPRPKLTESISTEFDLLGIGQGLPINRVEETKKQKQEMIMAERKKYALDTLGGFEWDGNGELVGTLELKVRTKKPPFTKFKSCFYALQRDSSHLLLYDPKHMPDSKSLCDLKLYRPFQKIDLHAFMVWRECSLHHRDCCILVENDRETIRLDRAKNDAHGTGAGHGFGANDPVEFDEYYTCQEVLTCADLNSTLKKAVQFFIQADTDIRKNLCQEAKSKAPANENPLTEYGVKRRG